MATVPFGFDVEKVVAHSSRFQDGALSRAWPVAIEVDDTLPPDEIRLVSGTRMMVLKLKPVEAQPDA